MLQVTSHVQCCPPKIQLQRQLYRINTILPYIQNSLHLYICFFLCLIIKKATTRLFSLQNTLCNLGNVLFKEFQVVFTVLFFVGNPVYLRPESRIFKIPISLQTQGVNLKKFKRKQFDQTKFKGYTFFTFQTIFFGQIISVLQVAGFKRYISIHR